MAVSADHVGKRVRVSGVALRARHTVPLAVAGYLQRVGRVDLITGSDQGMDPRASIRLDPDSHLTRIVGVLGDHGVQPRYPGDPFRKPRPAQASTRLVLQLNIVVVFRPVVPNEQHRVLRPRQQPLPVATGEPPAT